MREMVNSGTERVLKKEWNPDYYSYRNPASLFTCSGNGKIESRKGV